MTDHDIDLSAAIKAADYALRADNNAADNDSLGESWNREAEIAVEAALPHIIAQVEARVKPDREAVARAMYESRPRNVRWGDQNPRYCDEFRRDADAALARAITKTEARLALEGEG